MTSDVELMEKLTSADVYALGGAQCAGCGSNIAANILLRALANFDDLVVMGGCCGAGRLFGSQGPMGTELSHVTGVDEALRARGAANKRIVLMSGEGRTTQMGLGLTLNAFLRQQRFLVVVMNNETMAQSAYHATNRSPLKSNSKVLLKGKETGAAHVPLMVAFSGAKYVATATLGYPRDYITKIEKGLNAMPSYIDVLCPCESGWRYPIEKTIELTRLAVRSGIYPLWEWEVDESGGRFRRTLQVPPEEIVPVREYCKLQRRFAQMTDEDVAELENWISNTNKLIDRLEVGLGGAKRTRR